MRAAGYELVNADCVLIGEEPRIAAAPRRDARRGSPTRSGVEPDRVAVRATTTDRLGFTGRGEGLAAQAVALLTAGALARPRPRRARRRASGTTASTSSSATGRGRLGDAPQRPRAPLPERALERALLARRLVAPAARRAPAGERAGAAARHAREADVAPRSHQRLRALVVEGVPGPLLDARAR